MHEFIYQVKEALSSTRFTVGAPLMGSTVGVVSFFEQITPPLTVLSLLTGITLGILSYRLKCKKMKKDSDGKK